MISRAHRSVIALTVGAAMCVAPVAAQSSRLPELRGRVLEADRAAVPGAVVILVDRASNAQFRSAKTDDSGFFQLTVPQPGRYALFVERNGGAFLAHEALELQASESRMVALSLQPGEPPTPVPQAAAAGSIGPVLQWTIVGVISLSAVAVVNEVTDEKEPPPSPF